MDDFSSYSLQAFGMDYRNVRDKDLAVDLESGLPLIRDDSKNVSSSSPAKQGRAFFANTSVGFVGDSVKGEDGPSSYFNESNLNQVYVDVMKVTNNAMLTPPKQKRKKTSNKKAPKPPRPPQGPALDAADHKLIRELSELAMLKRARVERMRALKKMKAAKASSSNSSSSSSILAMIFTVIFFVVIISQGMSSSGKTSVASFQGSPVSAGGSEEGLISVQYQLTPSSYSNAPGSEPPGFVQQIAGSDFPERLRRDSG